MTDTTRENVERVARECDGRVCYASTNAEWPNRALQEAAALLLALLERAEKAEENLRIAFDTIECRNAAVERLEADLAALTAHAEAARPIVEHFALRNPRWMNGAMRIQDPLGAHKWLEDHKAWKEGQ